MTDRPVLPWTTVDAYMSCTCAEDGAKDCPVCDQFFAQLDDVISSAINRHRERSQ